MFLHIRLGIESKATCRAYVVSRTGFLAAAAWARRPRATARLSGHRQLGSMRSG